MPAPPSIQTLGTTSDLAAEIVIADEAKRDELKRNARKERDEREARGEGDRWSEMQQSTPPEIDKNLVGFRIEMRFAAYGDDGSQFGDWFRGTVRKIVNRASSRVRIEWDPDSVAKGEQTVTDQQLLASRWNPKSPQPGAWREYLTH